jgi:hypothetical protein
MPQSRNTVPISALRRPDGFFAALLNSDPQSSLGQNPGYLLADFVLSGVDFRGPYMVNPVGELKSANGGHFRNRTAQEINDLVVAVAVTIVNDNPPTQVVSGRDGRLFNSFGDRGSLKSEHRSEIWYHRAPGGARAWVGFR